MPSLSYVFLMSSGSSSQLAACFSVDRTKYLMLSKSMVSRSAPQCGIGLRWKSFRPFSRSFSIHSGSFFFAEMSRTTASFRPRCALAPATSESAQPYWYLPSAARCSSWVTGTGAVWPMVSVIEISSSPSDRCRFIAWRGRSLREPAGIRDVGGADAVPVGDGGQSLHVGADQLADHLGLRFAQLGELGRHMSHRTVVLAELAAGRDRGRAGSVSLDRQRLGQGLCLGERLVTCPFHGGTAAVFELCHLLGGEPCHRLPAALPGDPPQRGGSQVVVRVRGAGQPGFLGQREHARRTATAAGAAYRPDLAGHQAVGEHRVQVPADPCRRDAQLVAQLGRRRTPVLQQQLGDPVTGTSVRGLRDLGHAERRRVFHNTSVTYFRGPWQTGAAVTRVTLGSRLPGVTWGFLG